MKDTLCIDGGHSHYQFGVNLVFSCLIFTVQSLLDKHNIVVISPYK